VPGVEDSREDDENNDAPADRSERKSPSSATAWGVNRRRRLSRGIRVLIARRKLRFFGGRCHAFITADHIIQSLRLPSRPPSPRSRSERGLPPRSNAQYQNQTEERASDEYSSTLSSRGVVPISVNAVPALATANAAPIAMIALKPDTKDSSTARRISCRVTGS